MVAWTLGSSAAVEDAGRVAQAGGVKTLVLSHLVPANGAGVPVASNKFECRARAVADQYAGIKSRASFQCRSRSRTRSSARRHACEQKRCKGLRRRREGFVAAGPVAGVLEKILLE